MEMEMDIFACSDDASPSTIQPRVYFPNKDKWGNSGHIAHMKDTGILWRSDHNQFVMLELNYEKLKIFT